uniref:flagellin n=2 Tax=Sphingomonas TaxID=13687 RepID=UPI0035B47844
GATGYVFPPTVVSEIPIADGQTIQATESAKRVFQIGDPVTGTNTLDVLAKLTAALKAGGDVTAATGEALDKLKTGNEQIATVQASLGVRGARIEMQQALQTTAANDRAALRSDIEDVDITSAITEMQQIMTVLQATQASFTKLSGLSLFDYLK